jgi:hypothetical protein
MYLLAFAFVPVQSGTFHVYRKENFQFPVID